MNFDRTPTNFNEHEGFTFWVNVERTPANFDEYAVLQKLNVERAPANFNEHEVVQTSVYG